MTIPFDAKSDAYAKLDKIYFEEQNYRTNFVSTYEK